MMTCWPRLRFNFSASVRATRSAPPPGGKVTSKRIGRVGQGVCPNAPDAHNINANAAAYKNNAPRSGPDRTMLLRCRAAGAIYPVRRIYHPILQLKLFVE